MLHLKVAAGKLGEAFFPVAVTRAEAGRACWPAGWRRVAKYKPLRIRRAKAEEMTASPHLNSAPVLYASPLLGLPRPVQWRGLRATAESERAAAVFDSGTRAPLPQVPGQTRASFPRWQPPGSS